MLCGLADFRYTSAWKLMINLHEGDFTSLLARRAGVTYTHAWNIVKEWEEAGLVQWIRENSGRKKRFIYLTDKGREIQDLLLKLNGKLQE